MPDLTEETRVVCKQTTEFRTKIVGSKGDEYVVSYSNWNPGPYLYNWHCECRGFEFRGACTHVEEAKTKQCDGGEDGFCGGAGLGTDALQANKCPKCGGEVKVIKIAV